MNDISALRTAVQEWPAEDLSVPDIDAVIRGGRRIRLRRRVYAATALGVVAGAAAVLAAMGPLAAQPVRPEPAASAEPPVPTRRPDGAFRRTCPKASVSELSPRPVGEVISTGLRDTDMVGAERVFYLACRNRDDHQGTELVIITAVRHPDGTLEGAERTHGIGADDEKFAKYQGTRHEDGYRSLPCGYYIGPAARIVGVREDGTRVPAQQATWSDDPDLVVFWFGVRYADLPFEEVRGYDAGGRLLFAG